ncbi:unnamed protein product [Trifolium pratense]|uniref:Uncharacterized protein n=1 Tax=Trifolium pratense TaxID=57577 RepID=A0ACB0IDA9_TRIPR|nr:unnamed protein product [Trifolium pratense]
MGVEISLMENVEGFLLLKKERRVVLISYMVGLALNSVDLTWIRKEDQRANGSIGKVGISFNIMGQTQIKFCLILKELAMWAGIELLSLVQFNDNNWIMKKEGVGTVDYMNLKGIETGQCFVLGELGQTLDPMDLVQCYHITSVQEKRFCNGMALCWRILTHLLPPNDDYSVLQGGGKLHGNAHYAERMYEYMVMLTIQVDDDLVRGYTKEIEVMLHEQFLFDNLLEFIRSLKEFVDPRNTTKFLKFIILVLNGRNMKEETISVHLFIHTMNCYMEDIESGFLMLLEKPIAYALDPLDTSMEVFIFLAGPMIDYVRASVILKESNCRSPRDRVSEVVLQIRLFEADSTSFQPWDPGKEPILGSEYGIDQWPFCIAYALVLCYILRLSKHENYKFSKIIGGLGDMLITTFEFQEGVNFCNQSCLQKFLEIIIFSSILKFSKNATQVMVSKEVPRSLASIIIWKDKFVLKFLDFLQAVHAMFMKSSTSDKFLTTFLMFTWNLSVCYLEGLFHLANVKMVVLNSSVRIIPWDPGKFNVFMAKVACECYWRNFLSIYCLLNWVFGRRNHFQPLPTGLNEESQLEPEPEEALDTRRNDQGEVEVLVKWE